VNLVKGVANEVAHTGQPLAIDAMSTWFSPQEQLHDRLPTMVERPAAAG
jgi:hypothetical protein